MTQEIYQKAMKFAGEKHSDQKVPGSEANYLLHISNVAMEVLMAYTHEKVFDIDLAIQLAILHDTIEDTSATFEEVQERFGEEVARGVLALTKNKELPSKKESMLDSLDRINNLSKEVGLVKLADRITNLQTPPNYWDSVKINGYQEEAKLIAEKLKNKNEYLHNRLLKKVEEYNKL
ncbi:HD domain-containing protein [Tenacibaculum sp. MAR_2009_124]|uniref:HD domain-containing protein n=1 Tax=Tenacibaculum sp. MAR_2009_124 TaxID=1250059 RepID=UPI00089B5CC4|nr:HD domain-containing protein [Tenacibaculum sp. MAR_2009_124]SEB37632.1 HD domain-containing protein [Tenacibaculum sp. MAR_2009_124]